MVDFLLGALLVMAVLAGLGITRGRWLAPGPWVAAWTFASAALAASIVVDFLIEIEVSEFLHGAALGYIVGVTIHVSHHLIEGTRKEPSPQSLP